MTYKVEEIFQRIYNRVYQRVQYTDFLGVETDTVMTTLLDLVKEDFLSVGEEIEGRYEILYQRALESNFANDLFDVLILPVIRLLRTTVLSIDEFKNTTVAISSQGAVPKVAGLNADQQINVVDMQSVNTSKAPLLVATLMKVENNIEYEYTNLVAQFFSQMKQREVLF